MVWMYEHEIKVNEGGKTLTRSVLTDEMPEGIDPKFVKRVRVACYGARRKDDTSNS
jgi:hypothetical protein